MTVKELIQELSKYPQDMEVYYYDYEYRNLPVKRVQQKYDDDEKRELISLHD